jgi:hypothetical protein
LDRPDACLPRWVSFVPVGKIVEERNAVGLRPDPDFAPIAEAVVARFDDLPASQVTANWFPLKSARSVCQTPDFTVVLRLLNATRLPPIV